MAKRERFDRRKYRSHALKMSFGITLDDYERMLAGQNGVCAACLRPEQVKQRGKTRNLAVDHDHETKRVRGLLCSSCNLALGHLKDDPLRIYALANYILKHKER